MRSCEEFDRVSAASAWLVGVGAGVAAAEDTGGAAAPGKVASPGFVAVVDAVAGEWLAVAGALAGLGLLLRRMLLMRRRPGRWRHRASSLQLMLLLGKGWRLLVDWGV